MDGVRIRALEVAERREPTDLVLRALPSALRAKSPHVRYGATKLIGLWLEDRPELRATLAAVAQNDAEEKVRQLAQSAL